MNIHVPPWYGQATFYGSAAKGYCLDVGGGHPWPYIEDHIFTARAEVGAYTADSSCGTATQVFTPGMPPQWDDTYTVTQSSISWDYSSEVEGLSPYKERLWCEKPATLDSPCHPLHGAMVYAWGGDDYSTAAALDGAVETTTGLSLTPSYTTTASGKPIAASGTRGLAAFTVTLGLSTTPNKAVSGEVARWEDIKLTLDGDDYEPDLSGCSATFSGLTVTGSGNSLSLSVTSWASVPAGGAALTVTIRVPTKLAFDLLGYDWATAVPMDFIVPDAANGGANMTVASPYAATQVYYHNSAAWTGGGTWDDGGSLVWSVAPSLSSSWAVTNSENVTPADLLCTLEEWALTQPTAGTLYEWLGFKLRREAEVDVQLPADAGGVLPSAWVPDDANTTVVQTGIETEITVATAAANASVTRTLVEDWFSYYTALAGYTALGLPYCYQYLKHLPGSDVWCWDQYKFLRVEYYTEFPGELLTLRVNYLVADVEDDHMTGGERFTNLNPTGAAAYVDYSFYTQAGNQTLYIDLQVPSETKLQHVSGLSLRGFTGQALPWTFTLKDLVLTQYNPTSSTEAGHVDTKVVFARPEPTSGLPICYTGFTATADGLRCCRPLDQIVTLCGEEGLDFCARLTGRGTGEVLDALYPLATWFTLLNNQEGMVVDGATDSPKPCEPGHATYDDAFVDADANDMLGGLKTSDVAEVFDLDIATGASFTDIPCRPRVGVIYPCAGFAVPVAVRKHLHANIHGLARTTSGARAGAGLDVSLWEGAAGDTFPDRLQTVHTDDWSRYPFSKGWREPLRGDAVRGTDAPQDEYGNATACDTEGYNELRWWVDILIPVVSSDGIGGCISWHGSVLIGRHGSLLWKDEAVSPNLQDALLDQYNVQEPEGQRPVFTAEMQQDLHHCTVVQRANGAVWFVGHDVDNELLLVLDRDCYGQVGGSSVTIPGYLYPATCIDKAHRQLLLLARNMGTGYAEVLAPTGSSYSSIGIIATCDEAHGELVQLGDWSLLAFIIRSSVIYVYRSTDGGHTWTAV